MLSPAVRTFTMPWIIQELFFLYHRYLCCLFPTLKSDLCCFIVQRLAILLFRKKLSFLELKAYLRTSFLSQFLVLLSSLDTSVKEEEEALK